jgi:hypothetical protein
LDGADEAVTAAGDGLDETGVVGVVVKRLSQAVHGLADSALEFSVRVTGPEEILKLLAGNDTAGLFEKGEENSKRLSIKAGAGSIVMQIARRRIQFVTGKAEPAVRLRRRNEWAS